MNTRKILSLILVILMAIPLVPLTPTQAQTPTIQTSADPHGGVFTNNTWIEIKVTDPARAGDGTVTVNVYKNGVVQTSFSLTEVGTSGVFVLYVLFNSTDPNMANGWNVTFGAMTYGYVPLWPNNPLVSNFLYNGSNFTINLAANDTITFEYVGVGGTVTSTITYAEYTAEIMVDRNNVPAFGNSTVYVTIHDQDFNFDPTAADTIYKYELNFSLVDKLGNKYKGPVSYYINLTETGANTAMFSNSVTIDDVFTTLGYTGAMEYYNITQDYEGNNYMWVNFTTIANNNVPFDYICFRSMDDTGARVYLQRTTGLLSVPAQVSLSSELYIELTDPDANLDTKAQDEVYVNVTLDYTGTTKSLIVKLVETDVNTGVFEGTVYLNYAPTESADATTMTFYVNATRDITIEYWDPSEDKVVAAIDRTMTDYDPTITVEPTQVLPTSTVTITLTDMDLNDKGDDAVDSFGQSVAAGTNLTITFANNKQGYLQVLRNGQNLTAGQDFFLFFEEVEPGVFQATFDLNWIQESLADGDVIEFKWVDEYSGEVTASAYVTISKPVITVTLDRDVYPMPASGQFEVYVTVENAFANVNPGLKDQIPSSDLSVEVILWNGTDAVPAGAVTTVPNLVETDVDTGVFVGSFTVDITVDKPIVFTGATIKVYYSFSGNIYEATAVIRPSTASMTVNATTLAMGDYLYITVVEPDANTDSMQQEQLDIEVSGDATGKITLTETGVNTGVFEAVLRIGVDAPLDFAKPYKSFTLSFYDNFTAETSVTFQRDNTINIDAMVKAHDAEFYIGMPNADVDAVGPYSSVTIYMKDPDYILVWENGNNINLGADEAIYIRSLLGNELQITTLTPAEEPATFEATIQLDYENNPQYVGTADLNVTVPDNIVFRFVDPVAADGTSKATVKWLQVMAWDGQVEVIPSKPFYNDKEDITIQVTDPDANVDPNVQDSVQVKITSWRMVGGELQPVDPAGATITLVETEPDSGVFVAPYTIDTAKFPPFFSVGDVLKIEYEDKIAADGETKVTSSVMLQIGFTTATPITPGAPDTVTVADITGTPTTPKAGTPITLQVPVSNIDTTRSVTVDVILVAYMDGVPMGIGIAQVTIGAGESTVVNVPWIPAMAGDYEVKIFFWNLADKTPLAEEPLVLNITVSE